MYKENKVAPGLYPLHESHFNLMNREQLEHQRVILGDFIKKRNIVTIIREDVIDGFNGFVPLNTVTDLERFLNEKLAKL